MTDVTCPTTTKREDWDSAVGTVSFSSPTKPNSLYCKMFILGHLSRPIPQPALSGS